MKHPTSNSSLNLLHSFFVTLLFSPSPLPYFSISVRHFSFFLLGDYFLAFARALSCPSFLARDGSSASVPDGSAHDLDTFCTTPRSRHLGPLFLPCHVLPDALFFIFSKCGWCPPNHLLPSHFPGIFMFLLFLPHLVQRYLLVAAHHSIRCFLASPLCPRGPFFSCRWFDLFTVPPLLH